MAKVVIFAEVEDVDKWEAGFRTHGDLFKRYTTKGPILFGTGEGNTVGLYWEVEDLHTYLGLMDSDDTTAAMEFDGIKRDTVKVIVLDKELQP